MRPIIRTVCGDVDPNEIGITLMHEHLLAAPPDSNSDNDLVLKDESRAQEELRRFSNANGNCLVEMTTRDYGRDLAGLKRLSVATRVNIVAATGYNKGKFSDRYTSRLTTDQIVAQMVDEVIVGEATSRVQAGVIKASTSLNGPTEHERRLIDAAGAAHVATGAPVSTHTERGTWAIEQIDALRNAGVTPAQLLVGHLDHRPNLDYLLEVASTGVVVGLDQFGKSKYLPDSERVRLVEGLASHGYITRIALSGDMARASYWSVQGGPGFTHIPLTVSEMLKAAGFSRNDVQQLFVENPRRFLAFTPRT